MPAIILMPTWQILLKNIIKANNLSDFKKEPNKTLAPVNDSFMKTAFDNAEFSHQGM